MPNCQVWRTGWNVRAWCGRPITPTVGGRPVAAPRFPKTVRSWPSLTAAGKPLSRLRAVAICGRIEIFTTQADEVHGSACAARRGGVPSRERVVRLGGVRVDALTPISPKVGPRESFEWIELPSGDVVLRSVGRRALGAGRHPELAGELVKEVMMADADDANLLGTPTSSWTGQSRSRPSAAAV